MPQWVSAVFLLGAFAISAPQAQSQDLPAKRISVNIDAGKTAPEISPYIYGQFIEHIGPLINRSLWAEMLDDRKFYEVIDSKASTPSIGPGGGGPGRRRQANKWRPIGPDESVTMDRQNPYVGVHTPLIRLADSDAEVFSKADWRCAKERRTQDGSYWLALLAPGL